LRVLAGLRFDKNLIRQLLREEIMLESVTYQDILKQGGRREALLDFSQPADLTTWLQNHQS
jgi:hypothetical protein